MAISNADLVWFYMLDQTAGDESDSNGVGGDLTDTNTVTNEQGPDGIGDVARSLDDANSEYFTRAIEAGDVLDAADFTLAGWFKWAGTSGSRYPIISTWDNATAGCFLIRVDNDDVVDFFVRGASGNHFVGAATHGAIGSGWLPVICWYDHSAGTLGIRVNGDEDTASVTLDAGSQATSFQVGRRPDNGELWDGAISRFCKFDRLWSASEMTDWEASPVDYSELSTGGQPAGTLSLLGVGV